MEKKYLLLAALLLFLVFEGMSQNKKDIYIKTDTLSLSKSTQIIGLPIVFYTPETNFGIGGGAQFFYLNKVNRFNLRKSSLMLDVIYTSEKQLIIDANPKLFFNDGDYYLDAAFKFKIFPNSFWGIGPNTQPESLERYNMQTVMIRGDFLKRLPKSSLNFGAQYRFQSDIMLEKQEGGILASDTIPGSEGAIMNGLGFVFNLDDRDNVFSPNKGNYFQINAWYASKVLGSTYSFNKYAIDLRKYFPINNYLIIAARAYIENSFGVVPFQHQAWLGGGDRMRGYFRGRYIDNHLYTLQSEARFKLHPRWRANVFASIGQVAPYIIDIFYGAKFSGGAGIRYKLLKKNETLLRLDFGMNKDLDTGIYFGVNEAF
ncbi:BamA/TamA family outer membrane protein [Flammeovirga kamogawensis]|uniref:Outer membrane protein assembly factor n=1 Tax=Flammeovirga kamogawensis TaxID=373891 RepID=A0ABX8GVZ2_9BACT|nr:BamA/TamA family outer membrane protein [Flammeovirga kamogawensis]MBB6461207.1 outer membrane protein assembly factor BamA [Flammeovirga kamogawensis]QWG07770.1 outer membrane protein assembly factor [Flammeovirga kamogawensis]TRX69576.1 BamA/TamA family outer membrane protein [Flammeovirga kamogawensis]